MRKIDGKFENRKIKPMMGGGQKDSSRLNEVLTGLSTVSKKTVPPSLGTNLALEIKIN